jgi:hypothetical protein
MVPVIRDGSGSAMAVHFPRIYDEVGTKHLQSAVEQSRAEQ